MPERPATILARGPVRDHDEHMRHESCVTSISWIPSEAVTGGTRMAFDAGFTHYDDPPPGELDDVEALRAADRFRFANVLRGWIEVDGSGRITGSGYGGSGLMGATTVRLGALSHRFQAVKLPDLQRDPELGDGRVRFVQTVGRPDRAARAEAGAAPAVRAVAGAAGVDHPVAHAARRRDR